MKRFSLGQKVKIKESGKIGTIVGINAKKRKVDYAVRTEENPISELRDILTDAGKHKWYYANELKKARK